MEDTIVAISTNNLGIGAINIIRMSGANSLDILTEVFSNKKIKQAKSHTINYGYIVENNQKIDEVLVTIMKAPKTYTKEDIVEINCHGGYAVTNKILELLVCHGARLANPGEFTKRAFLNGRINLLEAESIEDLLTSQTENQSSLAMNHLTGKTTKLITNLREKLVGLLANIEVNIDYPEYQDELQITKENITPILTEIEQELNHIIAEAQNGTLIKNGIKIAIIGKPNVGKSSLLNALLEQEKAIVTDISGTTRDTIEATLVHQGIILNLIDTAGIRKTEDIVEKIGVEKSKKTMKEADITILVLNNNDQITIEEQELLKIIEQKNSIIFINKNDLPSKLEPIITKVPIIYGSALNKISIEKLKDQIIANFGLENINTKNMACLTNTRQITLAKEALKNIKNVIKDNNQDVPIDMLTIELKSAWENLGKIIGEYYEDELIDNIFQRFCLGK